MTDNSSLSTPSGKIRVTIIDADNDVILDEMYRNHGEVRFTTAGSDIKLTFTGDTFPDALRGLTQSQLWDHEIVASTASNVYSGPIDSVDGSVVRVADRPKMGPSGVGTPHAP